MINFSICISIQISKIKEKSRELSELKDTEFTLNCAQLNCTNTQQHTSETMQTTSEQQQQQQPQQQQHQQNNKGEEGHITKNESFFSEHLRNPSLNPLMLSSLNRLNKLEMSLDQMSNEESKITVKDAQLYNTNFNPKIAESEFYFTFF